MVKSYFQPTGSEVFQQKEKVFTEVAVQNSEPSFFKAVISAKIRQEITSFASTQVAISMWLTRFSDYSKVGLVVLFAKLDDLSVLKTFFTS